MTNTVKLKDICEFQYGKGLPQRERERGEFPVYGSGGIVDYHKTFLIEGPGIIVGRKGTIGSVFIEKRNFYPIDTVYYIRVNERLCDTKYLYYSLLTLGLNKLNTDAAVPGLNRNVAYEQTLFLPPKALQRKIASILSAYDDLIENNNRRIKILEEMAQAIYKEWFVNFRFPGHKKVKMVKSKLGMIPEGWEVVKSSDAIEINPSIRVDKDKSKPYVDMGGLSETSMIIESTEMRTGSNGSKYLNSDTLFARITPCLENGKTGFVQFLDEGAAGTGSTEFIVLRSKSLSPEFVYLLSRSEYFRNNAIKSMSGASGRQRVQVECFDKYQLAQPRQNVLDRFTAIVSPMFQGIHQLDMKNKNLRKTRDLLLPKLISGEIDVEKMDIKIVE